MPKRYKSKKRYNTRYRKKHTAIIKAINRQIFKKRLSTAPRESYTENAKGGVSGSNYYTNILVDAAKRDRQVLCGRVDWLNNQRMGHAIYKATGAALGSNRACYIQRYSEHWTWQNACLFPVVATVYKVKFNSDWSKTVGASTLKSELGVATPLSDHQALVGSGAPTTNYISVDGTGAANEFGAYSVPLQEIWKANLYYGQYPSTNQYTPAQRPFCHELAFGNDEAGYLGAIDMPIGLLQCHLKELRDIFTIKKVKVVTVAPGQQFSVEMYKKNKKITGEMASYDSPLYATKSASTNEISKGAECFLFEFHGLMVHDATYSTTVSTDANRATLNSVHRSTFVMNYEVNRNFSFRITDDVAYSEQDVSGIIPPKAMIGNEVRAGLDVEETTL